MNLYQKAALHNFQYYQSAYILGKKRKEDPEQNIHFEEGYQECHYYINKDFESGIQILEELISISNDEGWLYYIGAGELEEAFVLYGKDLISYLRKKNKKQLTASWKIALKGVWKNEMSEEVYTLLNNFRSKFTSIE